MALSDIVITGLGIISPLGKNLEENIMCMLEGRTGIAKHGDEPSNIRYYGKVETEVRPELNNRLLGQYKFVNRGGQLALSASIEAIKGQDLSIIPPEDRAFYLATGDLSNTGCEFMYPATKASSDKKMRTIDLKRLNRAAINKVNPFFLLDSIANNPFSFISAYLEFMGENTTIASLSPCGSIALDLAARAISGRRASIALVAASTTWINSISLFEMEGLGLLSRCSNGAASYAPFDKRRDGFIPSEGGAAIVIESEESALKRGASIFGRLLACSNLCENPADGGISVPLRLTKKTIENALLQADCPVNDLAFVCAHGSGSKKGDLSELRSLKGLFDETGSKVPICALKPYTGHMGAASDLTDIILSLSAIRRGIVPKTPNFKETEQAFTDLQITTKHLESDKKRFLAVSNGLGSQSAAVVIEVH